ncbi:MAG: hypothetical protein KQJ78_05360 [Deltaproteobacteria bacterium]|nr:hypothetical protein [Deltaproteobacteria bacterium]
MKIRVDAKATGAVAACLILFLGLTLAAGGCATKAQTGGLAGAGVGALIGQAIGHNTAGTLIGTGVGLGLGYIIGNEIDKKEAKDRYARGMDPETGILAGTKWRAVSMNPMPDPPYQSYILEFTNDGWANTTETFANGAVTTDRERYRVTGDTLILNKPGYLVNATYFIDGNRLTVTSHQFQAVFERVTWPLG